MPRRNVERSDEGRRRRPKKLRRASGKDWTMNVETGISAVADSRILQNYFAKLLAEIAKLPQKAL
jgi:hypothetical protein